jgi:hypothetical protein
MPTSSPKVIVLVDNSNVFIEGQKFSAKDRRIYKTPAEPRDPQDPSWRVDFGKLLLAVSEGRLVEKAILTESQDAFL